MSVGRIKVFAETTGNRANILVSMATSARRVGLECQLVTGFDYEQCDVAVMWGLVKEYVPRSRLSRRRQDLREDIVTRHRGKVVFIEAPVFGRNVKPHASPSWLIKRLFPHWAFRMPRLFSSSRAVIDPYAHYRIGLGGFPDDGGLALSTFCSNRWPKLSGQLGLPALRPFRTGGRHVIVIGQVPGDASLRGADIYQWMFDTCVTLKQITERPIIVRPHPLAKTFESSGLRQSLGRIGVLIDDIARPLSATLEDAWVVVTYSSGAAVDALLAGVPAIAVSPASFAWEVTDHDLESVVHPTLHSRSDWLDRLSAAQWCADEIARGDVWGPLVNALARGADQRVAA